MRTLTSVLLSIAIPGVASAAVYNGGNYAGADLVLADGDVLDGVFVNVGHLTIPAGATVTVTAGVPLEIYALDVTIDGTLDATGAGHAGGAYNAGAVAVVGNPGAGPGGGGGGLAGPCAHAGGAAGGSYGGMGGGGGYAFGNAGANPTNTYGVAGAPFDVSGDLGSGGGGGGTGCGYPGHPGGNGGGAVFIKADWITINGAIRADGADGVDVPAQYDGGGGGGSGGSIVLYANVAVEGSGTLSATGGDGGDDTFTSYESCGGGGGGGRIKIYNQLVSHASLTLTTSGGQVGICNPTPTASSDRGDPGQPGTIETIDVSDTDLDGIFDPFDNCVHVANVDQADGDADNVGDACDSCPNDPLNDGDDDGICDGVDPCPNGDNFLDTDGDGVVDGCDICPLDNPDDADGDGECDTCRSGNHDNDGDGLLSCFDNCPDWPNPGQEDADGDTVGDDCDICPGGDDTVDSDDDGFPDDCDNCPLTAHNNMSDPDGDGVGTPCDICPAGNDHLDKDADGVPNACDMCDGFDDALDADEDGIPDACDNCVDVVNTNQEDLDGDGAGTACDCDDQDPYTSPFRVEICDGIDNDCDGEIDEDAIDAPTYYGDADGDGRGDADSPIRACELVAGLSMDDHDCDDTRADIHPNAPEICDGIDNDCDDVVDGPYCPQLVEDEPDDLRGGCQTVPTPAGGMLLALGALALLRRRR